jgi:hypothetical protein
MEYRAYTGIIERLNGKLKGDQGDQIYLRNIAHYPASSAPRSRQDI